MALQATHIRFALEFKDHFAVRDIDAYVSGAAYPDSRYVTSVDERLTHPDEYLHDHVFTTSDFRKGWFVRLLCDTVQKRLMREAYPEMALDGGQDAWVKRTAVKILQDIDDVKKFDIATYLPCLAHVENPNGEHLEKMREYNAIFPAMYANPTAQGIGEAYEMWKKFGVGEEKAAAVRDQAHEYAKDERMMDFIRSLYDAMIPAAQALVQK